MDNIETVYAFGMFDSQFNKNSGNTDFTIYYLTPVFILTYSLFKFVELPFFGV